MPVTWSAKAYWSAIVKGLSALLLLTLEIESLVLLQNLDPDDAFAIKCRYSIAVRRE